MSAAAPSRRPPVQPPGAESPGLGAEQGESRIITFGCRLNTFESEVMRGLARAAGLDDAVIVNTCAVTAEAERQARQAIRRARRADARARIIVTGCAAQIDPGRFARMAEVDLVLGNAEKLTAAAFYPGRPGRPGRPGFAPPHQGEPEQAEADRGEADRANILVADIMAVRETAGHLVPGFEGRARAFVQVQQGCDHRCTFCIIPFARGPSRSVALGRIVAQARELAANGYREIVLTGVDLSSYGADLPGRPTLGGTVRRLLALVPEIRRLRLSSLDPAAIDGELMRLIATEERVMPHLHLSLQAGDDVVLKRMKRRHSRAGAVGLCARLRRLRPGITLGADLIAGFPTETEAMFENTRALVEDCGLTWLHVFPFSPRPGTPAARMPALPAGLARARAAILRAAGEAAARRYLEGRVGTSARVLVETQGAGHDEYFAPVRIRGGAAPGAIVPVRITGLKGGVLVGRASGPAAP